MQIKNIKMLSIGTIVFSLVNIWWVYLYTWTGIRFSDAFDPKIALRFTGPNAASLILLLLAVGFMIALSIFLARLFSLHLNKLERTIMVATGVVLPILACLSFFNNTLVFVMIMLFYMVGCLFLVYSKYESGGSWKKVKSNYQASKNVVTFLAVGSLVASLLFVYMNLDESKAKFKEAMLDFQSGINIGSFLSRDDVKEMVLNSGQLLTRDQIRDQLINGTATQLGIPIDQVTSNQATMDMINTKADEIYANQMSTLEQTIDQTYAKMTNSTSAMTRPIMEKMFASPPFSYLFDFLPILIAVVITSLVSSFGAIWISPMSGALGAFMPNPPKAPEPPKEPPMAKK